MKHHPPRSQPIAPDIAALAAEHHHRPEALVEILQAVQGRQGRLTPAALTDTARALHLPAHQAYGAASAMSTWSMPTCLGPAGPMSSVMGVISTLSRLEASHFRLRDPVPGR